MLNIQACDHGLLVWISLLLVAHHACMSTLLWSTLHFQGSKSAAQFLQGRQVACSATGPPLYYLSNCTVGHAGSVLWYSCLFPPGMPPPEHLIKLAQVEV